METDEIWKPIDGFDGYEVSNKGRVRSYWRNGGVKKRDYKGGSFLSEEPRILNVGLGHIKRGVRRYPTVGLYASDPDVIKKNGKRGPFTKNVHALVARAFIGERPEWAMVCHINGNPLDNRVENLRYDTAKGNSADARRHGTLKKGVDVNTNKLKPEHVVTIRDLYWSGRANQRQLAELFGVARTNITAIVGRRTWDHI